MSELTVGVICTCIGAVLGASLTEIITKRRENRNEKRQSESVRTILGMEIEFNLGVLKELWLKIGQLNESDDDDPASRKQKLARQFTEVPFAGFEREALESQLSLLARALDKRKIQQVFRFHDHLRRIEAIRTELKELRHLQRVEERTPTEGGMSVIRLTGVGYRPPRPFKERAPDLWDECERLVNLLLTEGNPFDS